jgi:hypothetical protein
MLSADHVLTKVEFQTLVTTFANHPKIAPRRPWRQHTAHEAAHGDWLSIAPLLRAQNFLRLGRARRKLRLGAAASRLSACAFYMDSIQFLLKPFKQSLPYVLAVQSITEL